VLRECFVNLYDLPILESLLDSLEMRFPDAKFPPIPKRGALDLNNVKESPYFFH
jgi:DNA-directed RNA polymerase